MKGIYEARLTAAIASSLTKLSMITSVELTAALIRFWNAIGPTTVASAL